MLWTNVAEKIKKSFVSNEFSLPKVVCGKMPYSQTGHTWLYNSTHAHWVLDSWVYKHALTISNSYWFSTATVVAPMRLNIRASPVLLYKAAIDVNCAAERPEFCSEVCRHSGWGVMWPDHWRKFLRGFRLFYEQEMFGCYANFALYRMLFHVAHPKLISKFMPQSQLSLQPWKFITM